MQTKFFLFIEKMAFIKKKLFQRRFDNIKCPGDVWVDGGGVHIYFLEYYNNGGKYILGFFSSFVRRRRESENILR